MIFFFFWGFYLFIYFSKAASCNLFPLAFILSSAWLCVCVSAVAAERGLSALSSWPTNTTHTLTLPVHHAGPPLPLKERAYVLISFPVWWTWERFYRCMCVCVCVCVCVRERERERGTLWHWFYLIETYKSTLLEREMWDILCLFARISDRGIDRSYLF